MVNSAKKTFLEMSLARVAFCELRKITRPRTLCNQADRNPKLESQYQRKLEVSQLSFSQLVACFCLASVETLRDPARADLVAAVGEISSDRAQKRLYNRMCGNEGGKLLLLERRRVTNETLEVARSHKFGTFGHAYAQFMDTRGFQPDYRPIVRFSNQDPWNYTLVRLREIHDYLHVLFECPTSVEGEIILKAIEFTNCKLPISGLGALIGSIQLPVKNQQRLRHIIFPWAVQAGLKCRPLESIDYESHFHLSLQQVRQLYGINKVPR